MLNAETTSFQELYHHDILIAKWHNGMSSCFRCMKTGIRIVSHLKSLPGPPQDGVDLGAEVCSGTRVCWPAYPKLVYPLRAVYICRFTCSICGPGPQ